ATVARLVAHQTPGRFAESPTQTGIATFGDVTLVLARAGTVFARAESEVAGDLPAILEALPVTCFALQDLGGERTQTFGQGSGGTAFNNRVLGTDLVMEKEAGNAQGFQQREQPGWQLLLPFGPASSAKPVSFETKTVLQGQAAA